MPKPEAETKDKIQPINLQCKLSDTFAVAFELIKQRPELNNGKNTDTVKELIRKTPEWKRAVYLCQQK